MVVVTPFSVLAAPVIVLLAVGIVLMDLERRERSNRAKAAWGGGVGIIAVLGFVVAAVHDGVYDIAWNIVVDDPTIARSPLEQDYPILLVGFAAAVAAVWCSVVVRRI